MMTFNLRRASRFDGANGWIHRRDAVADVILRQAPDILATQEGTLPMLADLDERLPGYERIGGDREHWPGEEPNALYYDPERVHVLDAGVFWLSRTPLIPGSRTWGDWIGRSALWAHFAYVETGGTLLVVNTHLDHVSMLARRRAADLVQRVAPHAVVMGDFNTWPRRYVHTALLEGRQDPLENARHTHNEFTRRDHGRIDWILVPEGLRVLRAEVLVERRPDGGPLSDHRPVIVDIEAPAPAPGVGRAPEPPRRWTRDTPVETKLPPAPSTLAAPRRSDAVPVEPRG
ncbi:MAG TPA: endonuclease/exonuclease/phosphatase family protein [Candidatus Thermoplasmatota archaeon]|nr:endonuclease/exonuclease/phosphatase family protein [Candidatus Thermoplasmatota archaeon]